jgi:hypothetical protein
MTNLSLESYITTDGQSASLAWNKAPVWGLRPDFFTISPLRVRWCWALSLTRGWVCRLQLLLVLVNAVSFRSDSHGTRDHILLSQIRDFHFRRLLRLARLRWRCSTPPPLQQRINYLSSLYNFEANRIEITTSNGSSIIPCPSVVAEACLPNRCLEMDVSALLLWLHIYGVQASCHNIIFHSKVSSN